MQTYEQLARQAARAYKRYFHNRDHSAESLQAMEDADRKIVERFGEVFIQVRRMGDPAAALVIYANRSAWRQCKEPVSIIPFASV